MLSVEGRGAFYFTLGVYDVWRGSLPALINLGDRVTWKVLAEYSWSPSTTQSGSFLVLQLVLRLFG